VQFAATTQPPGRILRYLAPAALAILLGAVIVVVLTSAGSSGPHPNSANAPHATVLRRLSPYWTVRPGDTYGQISEKTGLSVDQLEAFNPQTDPNNLLPGQRLKLSLHPPAPRPKLPGPRFWTVRPGESFGSIVAKTGINLTKLEQLNPKLKPTTLQPGDRVRLRP
jgi:LysM repeat protein